MIETLAAIEGKYEILEKLQVGGMGAIYKVRHRLLGDERVVKVMRPQLVHDPELQQRFHREARAATRLTHPNIARLYDFSVDEDGSAYIVMELIRGWTLDDLISRGELPPLGLALEIADQSLKAIAHLHDHGVIHRDISPDNLMLTRDVDGQAAVKLIDLGLVKSLATSGHLTATGVFVGKFRYASPEQFGGGATAGPPSDLYSLGLVLYELLTGRYPIEGESASSLIAGHLFRPPREFVVTDRVPDDLAAVVMRALAKEPANRYPTATAFAAALAPIRRRYDLEDDETRRILELIREPASLLRARPPRRGSTQSRFDRQFGPVPTPPPEPPPAAAGGDGRRQADELVTGARERALADDFTGARDLLRRALELRPGHPEALALQDSVDACIQVREEEERSEVELESTVRDIRDLVAAGQTGPALRGLEEAVFRFGDREELRALQDEALRTEDEDDEAALAATTLLETRDDDVAGAQTELLPRVRRAAPPPPAPRALKRSFDEISLQIPQQPRPRGAARFDAGDLPLGAATPAATARSERRTAKTAWVALVIVAAFLALGLGLATLFSGSGKERAESAGPSVSRLLRGLETPSAPLLAAAEAYLAGDFERTLAATAAGGLASPREQAWAHLLRAAACHALYVRGGEKDPTLRERTLEEIRAGRAADSGVVPGDGFAPSFVALVASTR